MDSNQYLILKPVIHLACPSQLILLTSVIFTPMVVATVASANEFTITQSPTTELRWQEESSRETTLNAEELEQVILALELLPILGLATNYQNEIAQLRDQLMTRQNSLPQENYQLSAEEEEQIREILSSLSDAEQKAVNYLLRSQKTTGEIELTAQEVEGLVTLLSEMPKSRLSSPEQEKLETMINFLETLPQNRPSQLSAEQSEALQENIAFVFFSPETQEAPISEQASSPEESEQESAPTAVTEEEDNFTEPITISRNQLQFLLFTLQGVETLNFSSPIDISNLISEFLGLLITPEPEVELSPQQRQQMAQVLNSLSPQQQEELDEYVTSEADTLRQQRYLSQSAITTTLEFLEDFSVAELTSEEESARQELLSIFRELENQDSSVVTLSAEELEEINTLSATLPETAPEAVAIEREELENLLSAIRDLPEEALSAEQEDRQSRLLDLLESKNDTDEPTIELSATELREINSLSATLPQLSPETRLVDRDRVLTILETARDQSLSEEQAEQLEALQTYFENQEPLNEDTTLTPVEIAQVEKFNAFLENLDPDQIRQIGQALGLGRRISPSISIENPSGFGGVNGSFSIGGVVQNRVRFTKDDPKPDASVGTSLSLGDPREAISVTTSLTSFSVVAGRGSGRGLGETGSISVEANRNLSNLSSVGVGVENLIRWGGGDSGRSTYLTFSQAIPLRSDSQKPFGIAYATAGLGNGRFRPEEDFDPDDNGSQFNFFGSAAIQVLDRVNLIAEWGGQDLNMALSIVPFSDFPIVITPAVVDITGSAGDGERYTLSISYGTIFEF